MSRNKKLPIIGIYNFLLVFIFIILQCTNIIDWNIIWIISPLWIPFGIIICFIFLAYIIRIFKWILKKILIKKKLT